MISGYQVTLSWDASSDNVAVAGYDVSCDDTLLNGILTDTSYIHATETPGDCVYTVEAYDAAGNRSGKSAPVSVTPGNTAPSITVSAEPGAENHTFIIRWSDDDPDDNAQISLYYDTDSAGNDGTLIVSGLEEDDETDEYVWDTADVPAGEYYAYAVIVDTANAPATAYSTGTVTVVKDVPGPEITTFTAEPQTVTAGEPVTLTWEVDNADTVTIDQGIGIVGLTGSATVQPAETVTYTLTAEGAGGTVTAVATVTLAAGSPVTLNITSPAAGNISRPYVMVRGTVTNSAGAETGVVVNGVVALVCGGQFAANHVPLEEGENTLTATATDTTETRRRHR